MYIRFLESRLDFDLWHNMMLVFHSNLDRNYSLKCVQTVAKKITTEKHEDSTRKGKRIAKKTKKSP